MKNGRPDLDAKGNIQFKNEKMKTDITVPAEQPKPGPGDTN